MELLLLVTAMGITTLAGVYLATRGLAAEGERHRKEDNIRAERRAREFAETLRQNPVELQTVPVLKYPTATFGHAKDILVMSSDLLESLKNPPRRRKAQHSTK